MMTMKSVLVAAGLFGGLILTAGSASAVPAGPSGLQAGETPVTQVRMMHGDRMMMKKRMMRKRMMKRRMMMKRM
ncbi:hypothetical protein [uncultured Methylobacterium sp.]|uniref:hypothetical protein n=1 Tax=uncultured Methylobacterium sp. TaxID=157278 RepID=UPI0035CAC68B